MDLEFRKLTEPTIEIAEHITRWENDPALIPLIRPNRDKESLAAVETMTVRELKERLEYNHIYLIYLQNQLIGEMDYQVDPRHLYKRKTGTAWIGIVIGEESKRSRGIGVPAIQFLEHQIREQGLKRIELGVFEFNPAAIKLYQKLGYREFARIQDFTFWQDRMWQDIRMEKYL